MGRKCCVTNCRTGYDSGEKTPVFCLPRNENEMQFWIQAIPRDNIPVAKNTVVCEKHWPDGYEKILMFGRSRPAQPPSVFDCVPKSLIPNVTKKRPTEKATSSSRNVAMDQLSEFENADIISSFNASFLIGKINEKSYQPAVVSFEQNKNVIVQSTIFVSGVPQFFIKIFNDFKFECYHVGVKCYIPSLSQNRIITLNRWSILDEAIKYLSSLEQASDFKRI